jgi:hypothetical protein
MLTRHKFVGRANNSKDKGILLKPKLFVGASTFLLYAPDQSSNTIAMTLSDTIDTLNTTMKLFISNMEK